MSKIKLKSRTGKSKFDHYYYCDYPIQFDEQHVIIKLSEPRAYFRFSELGYRNFKDFKKACHIQWLDITTTKKDSGTTPIPVSEIERIRSQKEAVLKECYRFIIHFHEHMDNANIYNVLDERELQYDNEEFVDMDEKEALRQLRDDHENEDYGIEYEDCDDI